MIYLMVPFPMTLSDP